MYLEVLLQEKRASNDINASTQLGTQELSPYPQSCSSICTVQSPWPGCGKPANEEQRMAATEKLQLLGKEPQPALQRYVDLVSTVFQVQHQLETHKNTITALPVVRKNPEAFQVDVQPLHTTKGSALFGLPAAKNQCSLGRLDWQNLSSAACHAADAFSDETLQVKSAHNHVFTPASASPASRQLGSLFLPCLH